MSWLGHLLNSRDLRVVDVIRPFMLSKDLTKLSSRTKIKLMHPPLPCTLMELTSPLGQGNAHVPYLLWSIKGDYIHNDLNQLIWTSLFVETFSFWRV